MENITIDELPEIVNLTDDTIIPVSQNLVTLRANLQEVKEFVLDGASFELGDDLIEDHNVDLTAHEDIRGSIVTNIEAHNINTSAHEDLFSGTVKLNSIGTDIPNLIDGKVPATQLPDALFGGELGEALLAISDLQQGQSDLQQGQSDLQQTVADLQQEQNSLHKVGEYHEMGHEPTPYQLLKWRWLPLVYQLIKISDYQELCDFMYCGDDKNDIALFWYKCDEDGTRNINGEYMRVAAWQGMFSRVAGVNPVLSAANNTPYDGKNVGEFNSFGGSGSPDYANMETINRIPTVGGSWTVEENGFVKCVANGQGYDVRHINFSINGKIVGRIGWNNATAYGINMYEYTNILEVNKGDIVSISGVILNPQCYFIPPRNNEGVISVNKYMTY